MFRIPAFFISGKYPAVSKPARVQRMCLGTFFSIEKNIKIVYTEIEHVTFEVHCRRKENGTMGSSI